MKKQLIRNTLWGGAELGVILLTGIVLPRIFVRGMTIEYYGLFVTLSLFSTYGILSMLDFGMGAAVMTFVARYHHTDIPKLRRLWTFSAVYFAATAILAVAAGTIILYFYDHDISVRLTALKTSPLILVPTLLMIALAFLSYLGEAFLFGFNDYRYVKGATIFQNIARLALIFAVVHTTKSLYLIIWLMAALSLARLVLITAHLISKYGEFTVFSRFPLAEAKEWMSYSVVLLVGSVTGFIFNSVNRILIAIFLPVSAMGDFDIASKPQTFIRGLLSALISATIPTSAHYNAAGEKNKLEELFLRGTFWLNAILFPPLAFIMVMMPHLILLWLGPGQERIAPYAIAIISYLTVFAMSASLANMILIGIGEAKRYIPVQIFAGAAALCLSVAGGYYWGLKGIIYAFLIGQVLANLGCLLVFMRLFEFGFSSAVTKVVRPHLKLLIPPFITAWIFSALKPPASAIPLLGGFGLCCAAAYGFYYFFYFDAAEKAFLLSGAKSLSEAIKRLKPGSSAGAAAPGAPI